MKESMKQFYNEDYYRQRSYEFGVRYPFFETIGKTLVEKFNPKRVLDIGCAKGYLVYALNEMGVEAYGVDISEYAISQSPESIRGFLSNVDVDFENLPFEPETFDMVTALECMEHLQNHNHLISEMKRVLKPGGIALMMTPKRHWDILMQLVTSINPTHINLHSKSFWIRTFETHGFHYIGDFPRHAQRDARRAWKNAQEKQISMLPPCYKTAKFLLKFGKTGRWLRKKLAPALALILSEALLFRS